MVDDHHPVDHLHAVDRHPDAGVHVDVGNSGVDVGGIGILGIGGGGRSQMPGDDVTHHLADQG